MNTRATHLLLRECGSALVGALFLIVVVAAFGVFAVRLQLNQQQTATLHLQEHRALWAAHAGLEYWSNRVWNNAAIGCTNPPLPITLDLDAHIGLRGFRVTVTCDEVAIGAADLVYEVTADAWTSAYGSPDFVRRTLTRRIVTPSVPVPPLLPTPGVYE